MEWFHFFHWPLLTDKVTLWMECSRHTENMNLPIRDDWIHWMVIDQRELKAVSMSDNLVATSNFVEVFIRFVIREENKKKYDVKI